MKRVLDQSWVHTFQSWSRKLKLVCLLSSQIKWMHWQMHAKISFIALNNDTSCASARHPIPSSSCQHQLTYRNLSSSYKLRASCVRHMKLAIELFRFEFGSFAVSQSSSPLLLWRERAGHWVAAKRDWTNTFCMHIAWIAIQFWWMSEWRNRREEKKKIKKKGTMWKKRKKRKEKAKIATSCTIRSMHSNFHLMQTFFF